jgi:hypothetical protein
MEATLARGALPGPRPWRASRAFSPLKLFGGLERKQSGHLRASMDAQSITLVAHQIRRGEKVVNAATFVGDHDDLDLWRRKRADWVRDVGNLIRDLVPAQALHELEQLASQPPTTGKLYEDLPLEIQRLREAVELLRATARGSG